MCPFSLLPLSSPPWLPLGSRGEGSCTPSRERSQPPTPAGEGGSARAGQQGIYKQTSSSRASYNHGRKRHGTDCLQASFRKSEDVAGKRSQECQPPTPRQGPRAAGLLGLS